MTSSACRCSSTTSATAPRRSAPAAAWTTCRTPAASRTSLGIPHYIVNFEEAFSKTVVRNFVDEYAAGRTPIPCVHCNADLKFATLVERAAGLDAAAVATGHYARVAFDEDARPIGCCAAPIADKDQSYFLFSLTQDQLARAHVSGRPSHEGRGPRARGAARPAGRRQARQPRDLLRARRQRRRFRGAPARRPRQPRERSSTAAARSWAGTAACIATPSASARASACRPAHRMYVLRLDPADGRVVVGAREELQRRDAHRVRRQLDRRRAPACPSAPPPASAIATRTRRPR